MLAETFRCGGIVTENMRNVFRYHKNTANTNSTNSDFNSSIESNETVYKVSNSSTNQYEVNEDIIFKEMAKMTRIVNGEDCPPGECPWQVKIP